MERLSEGLEELREALNEARKRILLYAQASLSPSQFQAFRKLILDEMGLSGIEGKARAIFERLGRKGQA